MIEILLTEPVQKLISEWPTLAVLGIAVLRLEMRMGKCFEELSRIIDRLLDDE